MFRHVFKLLVNERSRIFFLLMLISCKSFGLHSLTHNDFNAFLKQAETLNNTDPKAALIKLDSYQGDISEQSISNQINFYRIQSEAYSDQALYTLSKQAADKGLLLAQQMTNPTIYLAELAYTKGFAIESLGDFDGAFEFYQHGLDVARSMNSEKFIVRGLINLGAIYYLKKDYKQSLITLNQALKRADSLRDEELLGDITSELGILYGYLDEEKQANRYFQRSFEHYKQAGKHNYALNSLHNVATNHANQKRYQQAIDVYRILEQEIRSNTTNDFIFGVYRSLAWALLNKDDADIDNAYRYMMLAGEYVKEVEQHQHNLQYLIDKAYMLRKMERFDDALTTIEQAQTLLATKDKSIYKSNELEILYLTAALHFSMENYLLAYEVQAKYFEKLLAAAELNESSEIDELRFLYESDRATLKKSILEQKQKLQSLQLQEVKYQVRTREVLFAGLALLILVLAWGLQRMIKWQRQQSKKVYGNSLADVTSRQHLLHAAKELFSQSPKNEQPFSLAIFQLENLHELKEHLSNKSIARLMNELSIYVQQYMRAHDMSGLLSDEEFILVLPHTDALQAVDVLQRLNNSIAVVNWQDGKISELSINAGIATYHENEYDDFELMMLAAQQQLLLAKQSTEKKVSFDE